MTSVFGLLLLLGCVKAWMTHEYFGSGVERIVIEYGMSHCDHLRLPSACKEDEYSGVLSCNLLPDAPATVFTLKTSSTAVMVFKRADDTTGVLLPSETLPSLDNLAEIYIFEMGPKMTAKMSKTITQLLHNGCNRPLVDQLARLVALGDEDLEVVACRIHYDCLGKNYEKSNDFVELRGLLEAQQRSPGAVVGLKRTDASEARPSSPPPKTAKLSPNQHGPPTSNEQEPLSPSGGSPAIFRSIVRRSALADESPDPSQASTSTKRLKSKSNPLGTRRFQKGTWVKLNLCYEKCACPRECTCSEKFFKVHHYNPKMHQYVVIDPSDDFEYSKHADSLKACTLEEVQRHKEMLATSRCRPLNVGTIVTIGKNSKQYAVAGRANTGTYILEDEYGMQMRRKRQHLQLVPNQTL